MIVIDANILIYAADPDTALHPAAFAYVNRIFSGQDPIGLPTQTLSAFLRITTQKHPLRDPFPISEAVAIVADWLDRPNVSLLRAGEMYWPILKRLLLDTNATGRLVTDAEIAALTIEHNGILQTNDRDFARFPSLRWNNPLVSV